MDEELIREVANQELKGITLKKVDATNLDKGTT